MVKVAVDKWKLKKWFEVIAPALFKDANLGDIVANDYRLLIGRKVEKALSDITGDPKLQRTILRFRIIDVKGERALTEYLGHEATQDFVRSIVRRRTSKIYSNQTVETKDGRKMAVKSFIISLDKINKEKQNDLRKKLLQSVDAMAKSEKFDDFVGSVLYGKLSMQVKKDLHKVCPIRHVVIQKTEILQAAEVKPTEAKS